MPDSPFSSPDEQTDFSGLYFDEAAPKAVNPTDALFASLSEAAKAASSGTAASAKDVAPGSVAPAKPNSGTGATVGGSPAAPGATPAAATPAAAPAAPGMTPEAQAMLARLAPRGITSLDQLKNKTDVELRQLSSDVVTYESRQNSLNQFFKKNPDGTFDLTMGPDGTPTGLDAAGRVVPPAGSVQPAPAPAPTAKPAPKSVPKKSSSPSKRAPAKKSAPKSAPKRKTTVKRAPVRRPAARKPAAKRKPVSRVTLAAKQRAQSTVGRGELR